MSTSKLQRSVAKYLFTTFPELEIYENKRPEWLLDASNRRLELDFWIPSLDFAIEVNGIQHYEYSQHFHGTYENFLDQQKRDRIKATACKDYAIDLRFVHDENEALLVFQELHEMINPQQSDSDSYIIPERISRKQARKDQRLSKIKRLLHNAIKKHLQVATIVKRQAAMRDFLLESMDILDDEEISTSMKLLHSSTIIVEQIIERRRLKKNISNRNRPKNHRLREALEHQCEQWQLDYCYPGAKLNNAEKYLQAYHIEDHLYLVYGHRGVYEVYASKHRVSCECREHKEQRLCTHVAAVYLNFLTNDVSA